MIKLRSLIKEIETTDSDEWDSWKEYLDYFEYEIKYDEIKKIIEKYNLTHKFYFDNLLLMISDSGENIYLFYDKSNKTFELITDINDWIYNVDAFKLGIEIDNVYNPWIEDSLNGLRENPGSVYHYTTDKGFENIQNDKMIVGGYGTGINNRHAHGIFTSTNPEEYADGTYGDICLELNLTQFKLDNKLEFLNLSFEPEVEEYLIRNYIESILDIMNSDNIPSDISPYTIIVHHNIPLKYITEM